MFQNLNKRKSIILILSFFKDIKPKLERRRRLKKKDLIAKLEDDSIDIFDNNILDNYYPNRPDCLKNITLHDFVALYDYSKVACPKNDNHQSCLCLKNDFGYLHKRSEPKLIKVPYYKHITSFNSF